MNLIRITDDGDIFVRDKKIVGISWKPGDCVSKILVLAANAVRLIERSSYGKKKLG